MIENTLTYKSLNRGQCKTYAIWDTVSKEALIFDAIRENVPLYIAFCAYHNLTLKYIVDSHSHADHMTAAFHLRDLLGSKYAMHKSAPAPKVDLHLEDNSTLELGNNKVQVLYTPGHTPDHIALYTGKEVYTGDVLFIGGCGRTDFAGGDPRQSYDSNQRLFQLPEDTIVLPSHDYRFNTSSTIGIEKTTNPRLAGKSKDEFVEIMDNLGLPLPEKIMEALQMNVSAMDDNQLNLPTYTDLIKVPTITPELFAQRIANPDNNNLCILDVRDEDEFTGTELPGLKSSVNIPLKTVVKRISELEKYKTASVVCVCRVGVRSATAASVLGAYGFEKVVNLKGGLLGMKSRGV